MAVTVRAMLEADAEAVLRIYQAGLDTGLASFETVAPAWAAFDSGRLAAHRFVAVDGTGADGTEADGTGADGSAAGGAGGGIGAGGPVLGWVAVSAVSARRTYVGVVEHSVYVDAAARRRGIGLALLRALITSTEAAGIWTIQSSIFPENTASLRLHERAGFRVIGVRHHPGRMQRPDGAWRDTVLVERRSPTVYPS